MSSFSFLHIVLFSCYMIRHVLSQPNIIFILTDDQDLTLNSMQAMPKVTEQIKNEGMTFNNAFANTPVCCPSRTETVAGRLYHNVMEGTGGYCQGVAAAYNIYSNPDSFFTKFHSSGYITAGFGKVTNSMDHCNNAPDLSSFDRLHVSCDYQSFFTNTYFNKYVSSVSGEVSTHDFDENVYQTAMLGNASVTFIREQLEAQESDASHPPFIMWLAPYAPHSPADPAPWYVDEFSNVDLVKDANYNPSDDIMENYHPPVSGNPEITPEAEEYMLLLYKDRLRSLLSVDDMVGEIIDTIDDLDAWDNTYVFYTSDHGYHIGQYRLPCEKYMPYEETIRIPFYARGPGVGVGQTTEAMIQNIDFLPTFLDIAGISYSTDSYDGRSIKPVLEGDDDDWRDTLIFEYKTIKGTETGAGFGSCAMWEPVYTTESPFGQTASNLESSVGATYTLDNIYNSWRVLRIKNATVNWMYGEFVTQDWDDNAFENPTFYEFYDLNNDPFQVNNLFISGSDILTDAVKEELHDLVMSYGSCSGMSDCSPTVVSSSDNGDGYDDGNGDDDDGDDVPNGKGGGGGGKGSGGSAGGGKDKSNAQSDILGMDYNNYQQPMSSSFVGYSDVILVVAMAVIAFICLGVGIWIGKHLEGNNNKHVSKVLN